MAARARPWEVTTPERDARLQAFFKLVRAGDIGGVEASVREDPSLAMAYAPNQWCCRETPLNVAASGGDLDLARLLLDLGADPNQLTGWWAGGFAPLHSVPPGRADLIDLLVSRGAVLDIHASARLGLVERITDLLDHDPFLVNKPGGDGGRPLHFAADAPTAELLMDRGATIELRDVDHGSTAAQWAVQERPEVTRAILGRGGEADLFMLAALGDPRLLEAWLDANPGDAGRILTREDFPSPGSEAGHIYAYTLTGYGSAVLHVAAKTGAVEAIEILVERGADVMVTGGYDDQTPVHTAASNGRGAAVRKLAELGADVDALSGPEHSTPPLVWAIVFGSVEGVEALVEVGATVDERALKNARAGVKGEMQQFSRAPLEAWSRILEILQRAA